jgi:hypothetical protein
MAVPAARFAAPAAIISFGATPGTRLVPGEPFGSVCHQEVIMRTRSLGRCAGDSGALAFGVFTASPSVADVINDWNTAVAPPPPELKEVTVDPSTTAFCFSIS